jgi:uncharacterized membrane protein
MPAYNATASIIEAVLAILIALIVYLLLRTSLRRLLDDTVQLPAATGFYLRSFLVMLLLAALAEVVDFVRLKPDSAPMDYVWTVADGLGKVLTDIYIALLAFLVLITVLVAVLRRRHEH